MCERLGLRFLILLLFVSLAGCASPSYPRSRQWRDGAFHNLPSSPPFPTINDLFRWMSSRPERYPDFTPRQVANDGAALRQNQERVSITFIGHATMLVQAGGLSVLTDPVFVKRLGGVYKRYAPPGVRREDLPPLDAVLISHNHRDHLDESSVKELGPGVQYVVPLGNAAWFRARGLTRVVELDWWETTVVRGAGGRAAAITLVPAQHWSRRGLLDERKSLWGGYVIDVPGRGGARVYFAGDTGYPAAFAEIGRRFPNINYALLPIGAYEPRWFMHPQHIAPEEAVRAFRELGAQTLVPMHYATFRLSDEPMDEPPRLLRAALGADITRLVELAIGETYWGVLPPS